MTADVAQTLRDVCLAFASALDRPVAEPEPHRWAEAFRFMALGDFPSPPIITMTSCGGVCAEWERDGLVVMIWWRGAVSWALVRDERGELPRFHGADRYLANAIAALRAMQGRAQ